MIGGYMDLIVAGALVVIVLITLLVSRMGLLPTKSLPFVLGALAAIMGFSIWRETRMKGLKNKLEKQEEALKKREEKLKELKQTYDASEEQLKNARMELENIRKAYRKALLQLKAENEREKERIDNLEGDELLNEFMSAFGNQ